MTSINTNISAYYAQNNLRAAGAAAQSSIAKLSSGNRIIKASDDVAALSIGTILRTNVSTLKTALVNANQGSTLLQIADGGLARVGEILQRQKALLTQTNSGTLSANEKGYLNQEFQSLKNELDRIVSTTNFNGVTLLDGNISGASDLRGAASSAQVIVGLPTTGYVLSAATLGGTLNDKVVGSLSDAVVKITNLTGTTNVVSVTTHGEVFTNVSANLSAAGAFVLTASSGATMTITTSAGGGQTATANSQPTANSLAALIQSDLRASSVYQTRAIDSTLGQTYSIDADKFDGTILQGMTGASFVLKSNDYNVNGLGTPSISSFAVTKYTASQNGKISVIINGETYSRTLTAATLAASTAFTLTNESDSNSTIIMTTGTTAINVDTDVGAQALADTLNAGFGTGSAGGLNFQVGTASSDKIGITITGVSSANLYKKVDGTAVTMDLVTGNIDDMSTAMDQAIKSVTSRRADVGALQSRFGYAASALEVSVQNLDAARGQFLDADISEESTSFARAQVLQQAAISVLAQANQIPQNLLKLIS